jgi:hypothetical protein
MKKYLLLTAICLCADVSYGALSKRAQGAVAKFQPADPKGEKAAFLASAEARSILGKTNDEEGYLRELNAAFAKHERDLDAAALAGAGYDPAAAHGGDAAAAVGALAADRDAKERARATAARATGISMGLYNALKGRIQVHGGRETVDQAARGALHSDAKHTADVADAEARGAAGARAAIQGRIQAQTPETAEAVLADNTIHLYSHNKFRAAVLGVQSATRKQAHAQLVTLMNNVHAEDAGAVSDEAKERIRGWVNDMITALGAGEPIPAP